MQIIIISASINAFFSLLPTPYGTSPQPSQPCSWLTSIGDKQTHLQPQSPTHHPTSRMYGWRELIQRSSNGSRLRTLCIVDLSVLNSLHRHRGS